MKLQEAIARQIANNEARTEISGIDIADAGNVLTVILRFFEHNMPNRVDEQVHKTMIQCIEEDHMP